MYPQKIKHANMPISYFEESFDFMDDVETTNYLGIRKIISLDGELMGHFNTKHMTANGRISNEGRSVWAIGMIGEPCAFTIATTAEYLYNMGEPVRIWGKEIIDSVAFKEPIGVISVTQDVTITGEPEPIKKTFQWLCYGEYMDGYFLVQIIAQCDPKFFIRFPVGTFIKFTPLGDEA